MPLVLIKENCQDVLNNISQQKNMWQPKSTRTKNCGFCEVEGSVKPMDPPP